MPVSVGDRAPDFELPGRFDREAGAFAMHRLSAALAEGPVILHFFPAPFTAGCEGQMCQVRDNIEDYRGRGVTVWGVTSHPPAIIGAWARIHRFGVPVLADYDRGVSEAYVGVYAASDYLHLALCSRRAMVAVGRDGVVAHVWIGEGPGELMSAEEIERALRSVA